MPTPKRPSARCAEGLFFCPGIVPSPKDGGDDGADTASIRRGDGERPAAGWDRTANRMKGRRSGDGAVFERRGDLSSTTVPCAGGQAADRRCRADGDGIVDRSDRCGITPFAVIFRENIWGTARCRRGCFLFLGRDGLGIPWGASVGVRMVRVRYRYGAERESGPLPDGIVRRTG